MRQIAGALQERAGQKNALRRGRHAVILGSAIMLLLLLLLLLLLVHETSVEGAAGGDRTLRRVFGKT